MSRTVVFAVALLTAAAVRADPVLEATASVVGTSPRLQLNVVVTNRGDTKASSLAIEGEMLGQRREAELPDSLEAGRSASVTLDFDAVAARPGVYALVLLLEHPIEGPADAAGNPPLASRRVGLLLPLGVEGAQAQAVAPAVSLAPRPCLLDVTGRLEIVVASTDGRAHRVRLSAFAPRGLRVEGHGIELEVPAEGGVSAALPLVRAGAARGTPHDVVTVAETTGEPLVRTSLASASVQIAPYPSLFPRVRRAILLLACLLLAVAVGVEIHVRRSSGGGGVPGPPARNPGLPA